MEMLRPERRLAELLLSLFDTHELALLIYRGPEGRSISQELPVPQTTSLSEFAHATALALQRHGLLNDEFFRRLMMERPRREAEILSVREAILGARASQSSWMNSHLEEEPPWDFFLSYSSEQRDIADVLFRALAQRSRVFVVSKSLTLGDQWDKSIAEALRGSRIVVVLVSGRTALSDWHKTEINAALATTRSGVPMRVVPVWLEPTAASSEIVPYKLRGIQGLDVGRLGMDGVATQLLELRARLVAGSPRTASPKG